MEHKDLFEALRKVGINEGYVQLLEAIYINATDKIYIENDVSNAIQIGRGVRQGDTISPKMFTVAMEEIFKKLNLQEREYAVLVPALKSTSQTFSWPLSAAT